jgi:hypothetical protein
VDRRARQRGRVQLSAVRQVPEVADAIDRPAEDLFHAKGHSGNFMPERAE